MIYELELEELRCRKLLYLNEAQDKTLILIEARTNRISNELELCVTFNLITGVPH